eukprot:6740705-Alexandrium_andersonii.AAC.1
MAFRCATMSFAARRGLRDAKRGLSDERCSPRKVPFRSAGDGMPPFSRALLVCWGHPPGTYILVFT